MICTPTPLVSGPAPDHAPNNELVEDWLWEAVHTCTLRFLGIDVKASGMSSSASSSSATMGSRGISGISEGGTSGSRSLIWPGGPSEIA